MGIIVDSVELLEKLVKTYRQLEGNPQIFRDFTLAAIPDFDKAVHFVSEFGIRQIPALEIWIDPGHSCYDRIICKFVTRNDMEYAPSIGLACEQAFESYFNELSYSCFMGASRFLQQLPYFYDWFGIYRDLRKENLLVNNARDLLWTGKLMAESINGPCFFAVSGHHAQFIGNNEKKEFFAYKCRDFPALLFLHEGEYDIIRLSGNHFTQIDEILSFVETTPPVPVDIPLRITRNIVFNRGKFMDITKRENPPETTSNGLSPCPATI